MQGSETIWLTADKAEVEAVIAGEETDYSLVMTGALWIGDEPPFSQDEGLIQIPVRELFLTALQDNG